MKHTSSSAAYWVHIGSGRNSDVFKCSNGKYSVIAKVSYYRSATLNMFASCVKAGDEDGARKAKRRDAVSISSMMGTIANSFVRRCISPHFVLQYGSIDCKDFFTKIQHEISRPSLSNIQKRYTNIGFLEVFQTDVTKFLSKPGGYEDADLRVIIFQIVFTLAALQAKHTGFRHNDLSTNNILIRKSGQRHVWSYTIRGTTFYVKTKILTAISDFDFTHIPGKMENERILSPEFAVDNAENSSYDTHFFLKSIVKCIGSSGAKVPETRWFLRSLRLKKKDRFSRVIPKLIPSTLLLHSYFDRLKRPLKVSMKYRV